MLALLLLGVLWGVLNWLIVPRIGEFRPQLEARASRALGVPVRVGAISATASGLIPSFELTDVALFDRQGRVALSLPRVLVALSPRSLWRSGFEQLYIDQPKLDIRRSVDGRISIAGLDFSSASDSGSAVLDWFFSQIEFAVHDGVVRWTDEQRQNEPVVLQQVDLLVRNLGRHHDVRLDATPPEPWGGPLSIQARFMQPLLSRRNGQWRDWDGVVFASSARVDLAELRRHADPGFDLSQGKGALRTWLEFSQGHLTGVTTDVAITEVAVTLGADLQPLVLNRLQGRISGRRLASGFELATKSLAFDTADGLHWPGGNIRLMRVNAEGKMPACGELEADRLDLAALTQIASSLPLDARWREQLARYTPKGLVEKVSARWQGSTTAPGKYNAKGRLSQFELAAVDAVPGVRGLDLEFELDQAGGRARLSMSNGRVDVPEFFQDRLIHIDSLSATAKWQQSPDKMAVQVSDIRFANADAQGQAQIKWQTADPKKSPSQSRFPGLLDLQATLSRADGRQVHRYLPLVINSQARDYVRDAVQDGSASNVRFLVKGNIEDIPALDARRGMFRISADVRQARLAYVPRRLQGPQELPWPELRDLSGELVIDRMQLLVKGARARIGDNGDLQVMRADATIADLMNTEVKVNAEAKGPLPAMLRLVNNSPLGELTGHVLKHAVVTGDAGYRFQLALPIADLAKSTVQGSVLLVGNDVQISPDTPKLSRSRGSVNFTHTGVTLAGVQTRLLGGEARLDGGLLLTGVDNSHPSVIRATGVATAEGLRQATELGLVAQLARQASGSASYNATLGWRQNVLELLVTSNLQGMATSLPAPLAKDAPSLLPLRYQTALPGPTANRSAVPLQDRLTLTLGRLASAVFERDISGDAPKILRGAIGVGADTLDSVLLPEQGIHANIHLPQFNVDAWSDVLAQLTAAAPGLALADAGKHPGLAYLPTALAVRAETLTFGARRFSHLVIGASRDGLLWRANVDAAELNGYLEYRQPQDAATTVNGAGRVYARLARLTLAPGTATEVEQLLDAEPASVPALDVVVDDFELRGKRLGRLEVDAINRQSAAGGGVREWRLNKLNLNVPEASLTASGNWTRQSLPASASNTAAVANPAERRRTLMNFRLDILDGGSLLNRFGMKDVVRQASGKIEGQMAWIGSPLKIDYPTLGGAFTVNIMSGQFLKADPGIAKLLGVLSLQALPRRLSLDFRDVFSTGFAFDFLRGDVTVDKGLARTNNLQMKGVNAAVLMEGVANMARETQDIRVVVVPELNAGTASLIATVINPAIGLGSFLAQLFLRRPLIESATQEFHVDGSWADPQVTRVDGTHHPYKETTP